MGSKITKREGDEERQRETFGDVDVALPMVDIEAPDEAGDEVEDCTADVVAEPRLERAREALPGTAGYEGVEHNAVVPVRLLHETVQVIGSLHAGDNLHHRRRRDLDLGCSRE